LSWTYRYNMHTSKYAEHSIEDKLLENCSEIIHRIKQMYSFEFAKDCGVKDFKYPFNIKNTIGSICH